MTFTLTKTRLAKVTGAAAAALALLVSVAACGNPLAALTGPSDEELIRTSITKELDQISDPTSEFHDAMIEGMGSTLSQAGVSDEKMGDLADAWLGDFDYSVDDVTVDGDTASVEATLSVKQFGPLMGEVMTDMMSDEDLPEFTEQAEATQYIMDSLVEKMNSSELTDTPLTLDLKKKNNVWDITTSEDEISATFLGDMSSLQ